MFYGKTVGVIVVTETMDSGEEVEVTVQGKCVHALFTCRLLRKELMADIHKMLSEVIKIAYFLKTKFGKNHYL